MNIQHNAIIITGPTASGKTALAVQLAYAINGEIISADSRQVYKGLTIGTGKDLDEYLVNNITVNYHLIDIANVESHFHLHHFITEFYNAFKAIENKTKIPIICGGTGLYLDAILKQHKLAAIPNNLELRTKLETYTEEYLIELLNAYRSKPENTDYSSHKRLIRAIEIADYLSKNNLPKSNFIDLKPIIFALDLPKELRKNKISIRLKHRLEYGMIEEVNELLNSGIPHERLQFLGLEYFHISKYILNEISYEEMVLKLEISIHQYAKRQMTWFRKMEREGNEIIWLDATKPKAENLKIMLEEWNKNG